MRYGKKRARNDAPLSEVRKADLGAAFDQEFTGSWKSPPFLSPYAGGVSTSRMPSPYSISCDPSVKRSDWSQAWSPAGDSDAGASVGYDLFFMLDKSGWPCGIRTRDSRIMSPLF